MSKTQIFGQRDDRGYFALFGHFEGVLIYIALAAAMALCLQLTGEITESGMLLAPLAVGLAVLAGLRFRLAGAIASGVIAASTFWVGYGLGWGMLPEEGIFLGVGLVLLVYFFSFCASSVVSFHVRKSDLAEQRENMQRQVLDSLPIGVWVRSRGGQTVFVNQRWADFSGISSKQILESCTNNAPVDLGENWESELEQVLHSDGDMVRYRPIELKDNKGQLCALNWLSLRLYIDHLQEFGTLSLLVDTTAVRKRDQRFEESQNNLSLAMGDACIGFWSIEFDTKKLSCDSNWRQLLGMASDSPLTPAQFWRERLHPDDEARVNAAYEAYYKDSKGMLKLDCRVRNADGSYMWVNCRARVVEHQPDGSPKRVMGTTQDISDQKAIELDLKQAKEAAEVADAAKSHFIASISHEIRTPLNAIIGLSSFLAESELDEEELDLAQTIHTSGKSLLFLVNDLLDFSRIEAGHFDLEVQEYPIRELFEDCIKLFSIRAREKALTLKLEYDATLPGYAMGDMSRLRQIVQNLLSNALKFTERGGVEIRVGRSIIAELPAERRPDPLALVGFLDQPDHEYLEVRVRDSGIGISKEQQHLLFEPFSQVDSSAKRKYEGTGLGLVICKRLVNAMGGRIWLDSDAGCGAEFGFVIRTKLLDNKFFHEDVAPAPPRALERIANVHPCDILIVGPEAATEQLVVSARKLGYAPHRAFDFNLTSTAYRRRHYNLIFVWMADVAEALDFARKIRLEGNIKQPESIIGLLPEGSKVSLERCHLNGMQQVIQGKPEPASLREFILEQLETHG